MIKRVILSLFILITVFIMAGCGNNTTNNPSSNNNNQNNINNNTNNNSKTNNDSLTIQEIKKEYTDDLPLGLETNYVNVNGSEVVIRVQTSGSSKQQEKGPY